MRNSRLRAVCVVLLVLCLPVVKILPGYAIDVASLSLGDVEGVGWSASGVTLQARWIDVAHLQIRLQAASAHLSEQLGTLDNLQLVCEQAELTATYLDCPRGTLTLQSTILGKQNTPLAFRYHFSDGRITTRIQNIRYLGGRFDLKANTSKTNWTVDVNAAGVSLPGVVRQVKRAGYTLPSLDVSGTIDVKATLHGRGDAVASVRFDTHIRSESFSDESGRYAGEELDIRLSANARLRAAGWKIKLELAAEQGAVYIEPVYIAVPDSPIVADADISWQPKKQKIVVHDFNYRHPQSVQLAGSGRFDLGRDQPLTQLQLEITNGVLPALYDNYLQPWVDGTLAGNLEAEGQISGLLKMKNGAVVQASANLQASSLREKDGLFGFKGLAAELDWSDTRVPEYSALGWDSGHVYRVELGRSDFEIESIGNTVQLVKAARIPVLDGALDIESFSLDYSAAQSLHWKIDSILTPISMSRLTRALDWPEFGGKLSGVIPQVSFDKGELAVGGVLLVRVFDGVVTLRNLKLKDTFGLVPRMQVNALADNIDLEMLTSTFSFGRIEGRLDGRIDGLLLESWRPVAFDAEFATPVDDRSRHRISQKAVDNISNIGGSGVGGALSRSFLRFLKDFPYARLGIRCRLENGACAMGGVEPAENGYYLVKGRFLPPRIDVVGYADRVDWDSLVAQIIAVTKQ